MNSPQVDLFRHSLNIRLLVLAVFPYALLANHFDILPLLHLLQPAPVLED